jgi:hypothetical protein
MSKRQKIVIATFVLLAGIIFSRVGIGQFLQWRFRVALFAVFGILATLWALRDEDFSGIEWLTLPILPTMFAIASLLTFPLLPAGFDNIFSIPISADTSTLLSLVLRIVFLVIFVTGYYASILSANIFNIAAIRDIQLRRVAHSIGFLSSVATALLFYMVIFSFHLNGLGNFLGIMAVSFPLIFQALWSVKLENKIGERVVVFAAGLTIILGEIAWVLSFFPINISVMALFLTAIFYEMVGIIQYYFDERLSKKIANEFIIVAVAVFLIAIFSAQWGM